MNILLYREEGVRREGEFGSVSERRWLKRGFEEVEVFGIKVIRGGGCFGKNRNIFVFWEDVKI